jgi:hypothetical protein
VPFLGSTAALCLSITKSVQVSRSFWLLTQYLATTKNRPSDRTRKNMSKFWSTFMKSCASLSSFIQLQKSGVSFQQHSCMTLQNSQSESHLMMTLYLFYILCQGTWKVGHHSE